LLVVVLLVVAATICINERVTT